MSLTDKNTKDKHLTEEWWQKYTSIEDPKIWAKSGGEFSTGPLPDTKEAKETSIRLYKELLIEREQEKK